jgi:hypothetical protein
MKPIIYLAFVDDWELSGDGSGDPHELQFRPMRELTRIYAAHGIRGSFNAEVMQQLTFRKFQDEHPKLRGLADEWDLLVRETFGEGHDIQLHIHPQWSDAEYTNGTWNLKADWSILKYPIETAEKLILSGKHYLENLLRPIKPDYACVSFRSGSWCIAPSPHILGLLSRLGIVFDMSIVGGVRYQTRRISLDYSNCEEDFLPFYPMMRDARRVSNKVETIICVPTNHFYGSRRQTLRHHARKAIGKVKARIKPEVINKNSRSLQSYGHEWTQASHSSPVTRVYEKGILPYLKGKHLISDLAQLDYPLMLEMLRSIRRRARARGLESIPIILENHTKDVRDFSHIERFVGEVSQADDIECLTLSELARDLEAGKFHIKTSGTQ